MCVENPYTSFMSLKKVYRGYDKKFMYVLFKEAINIL